MGCVNSSENSIECYLYYWDDRDGPSYQGWWITTQVGSNAFIGALTSRAPKDQREHALVTGKFVISRAWDKGVRPLPLVEPVDNSASEDVPQRIRVSGAGSGDANGEYLITERSQLTGAPNSMGELVWRKAGSDICICHSEDCWWIGDYHDCTADYYRIPCPNPFMPPISGMFEWQPCMNFEPQWTCDLVEDVRDGQSREIARVRISQGGLPSDAGALMHCDVACLYSGSFYSGKVESVLEDGTFNVAFDDGDRRKHVPRSDIKSVASMLGADGDYVFEGQWNHGEKVYRLSSD